MQSATYRSLSRVPLLGIVLFTAMPALAQRQDEQFWFQANTNVPLAKDFRVTLEQIARFGDRQGGLYQSEVGALFGYRVAPGVEFGAGYRYVGMHNGNTARDEHRLRQQVIISRGRFTTRFRVDERFHPEGDEIGFRIRPLVRYNHPLSADRRLALFISHESFIMPNRTKWGQARGYDRMRNIVGLVLPVSREVSADIGYLNQYRPGRHGGRSQMDHALSIQLTINLKAVPKI
ncbi:DUF2490 domain-containing protein [Sphingomonas sp. ID0503]|uniref:DUF2490 domain-containing protein n=1 Tax=Sphingomonas sp. ID0503 TaxID=3399691 RepID=UPI003AFA57C8